MMRNLPVRDQRECPWKMKRYFPIKQSQPMGMPLTIFSSFLPNSLLLRAKNRFVKNETTNSNLNGDLEYSGHKNSDKRFRNLCHDEICFSLETVLSHLKIEFQSRVYLAMCGSFSDVKDAFLSLQHGVEKVSVTGGHVINRNQD